MISLRRIVPNRWLRLAVAAGLLAAAGLVVGRQVWAYSEYRAAKAALGRYKFLEARAHVRNCLTVWSSRPSVWLLAGQVARRMEEYDEAERCYAEAQRRAGGPPGEDLLLERAMAQAQLDPDAKEVYFRSLVESDHPQSGLILEAMVRGYLQRSRYKDAGFLVERWLERAPDDPYALFCRAWVREELGPEVQAIEDYQRVLELDPDQDEARLRLARMLLRNARAAEALEVARALAARHPGDPVAQATLAAVQAELGDLPAAEASARAAVAADPNSDDALVVLGRVLIDTERYDEAEKHLRAAIRVRRSNYQAHQQLHRVLALTGRAEEAARLKADLDQMSRDISRLRKIFYDDLARSPETPALCVEVAEIFIRAGEVAKGVQWLHNALRLAPSDPRVHRELADAYARLGDAGRADYHRKLADHPSAARTP